MHLKFNDVALFARGFLEKYKDWSSAAHLCLPGKCLKCYILETKIFKKDLKIYTNVLLRNNHYRSKASF